MVMNGAFQSAQADPQASIPFDTIVICTPQGLKTFSAAALLGGADETSDGGVGEEHCPWCQAFGAVLTPARVAGPVRCNFSVSADLSLPDDITLPLRPACEGFDSRAPPV